MQRLNPERWLGNFDDADLPIALHLLNSFVYISEPLTRQLFRSAFHELSSKSYRPGMTFQAARNAWMDIRNRAVVTHVTGEMPNPADSGHIFVRYARDDLGIDQDQILDTQEVVQRLGSGASFPLIVVDDFCGSGQQFIKWWTRCHPSLPTDRNSMAKIAGRRNLSVYVCVAAATAYARDKIQEGCDGVTLIAGNLLPPENSVFHSQSNIWPEGQGAAGVAMIERYSRQCQIPDSDGGEDDWRGFHKLGLCVTFSHSTPDATLPLFTWNVGNWQPLLRRS